MNNNRNKKCIYEILGIFLFTLFLLFFTLYGSDKSTDILYRLVGVLFCGFELFHILKTKKILISPFIKYLILFFIFVILFSYFHFKSHSGVMISIYISLYICIAVMAYNFFNNISNGREKLLNILMFNGIIISFYIFFYYGFFNYFQLLISGKRVGQEVANVNTIGLNTIISSLIIFYKYMFKANKKNLFFLIPLLIISLGTGSKKVIIVLIIGVTSITLLKYKGNMTKKSLVKLFFTFLVLMLSFMLISKIPIFDTIFTRFKNLLDSFLSSGEFDAENKIREDFIQYGFRVFLNNPIIGIGYGNSSVVLLEKFNYSTYFHNNYVELLSTTGIIGTCIYYLSYFASIKFNLKQIRFNKNDSLSYLCLVFIFIQFVIEYGMVSNQLPYIYVYLILWNLKSNNRKEHN